MNAEPPAVQTSRPRERRRAADVALESILATSARALELEAGLAEAHASRALGLSLVKRDEEA